MANIVRNLPNLVAQSTGTGSFTNGLGALDDASSLTVFMASSAGIALSAVKYQIAQFDPVTGVLSGANESTGWFFPAASTAFITSSGHAFTISNISFRGFRLIGTSSAATGEVVAFASKQISV
jgi:hypothetical protein